MPDEVKKEEVAGIDLDSYTKEREDFGETVDDILAMDPEKSDEEIIAALDAKRSGEKKSEAGTAIKDSADKPADAIDETVASELLKDGQEVTDGVSNDNTDPEPSVTIPTVDPNDTSVDWKSRSAVLETELAKERQKTSSWNGRISAANKRVKDLEDEIVTLKKFNENFVKNNSAKPVADPTTDSDNEVLERLSNDFPELSDVIGVLVKRIDGIQKTDKDVKAGPAQKPEVNPLTKEHMNSIRAVHPDLGEMVRTGVLQTWINRQPDYIRPTLQDIYDTGHSGQVIKMCTEFKNKSGWKSQLDTADKRSDDKKSDKLKSLLEVNSSSGGAPAGEPDRNDYAGAAKEAGL